MKTIKEIHAETATSFKSLIGKAGLSELYALEKSLTRYYNRGLLSAKDLGKLDVRIMEEIARFDCIA
jgi:hypothetical protein